MECKQCSKLGKTQGTCFECKNKLNGAECMIIPYICFSNWTK